MNHVLLFKHIHCSHTNKSYQMRLYHLLIQLGIQLIQVKLKCKNIYSHLIVFSRTALLGFIKLKKCTKHYCTCNKIKLVLRLRPEFTEFYFTLLTFS